MLLTTRLLPGLASLRRRGEAALITSALVASSATGSFRVVHHSIQSSHLHLIVEARDLAGLSAGTKGLLVRIARGLNRIWDRRGSVFSDRYHARELRTPREVRNALVYVLHNARKHGIVHRGADPCSSGIGFDGWADPALRVASARTGPRAQARTWLLSVGWTRWGRIRFEECPALPGPRGRRGRA